ncbi:MAG: aldehyde dehydrogenase family protein [Acidobacteriota bacterium]
MEALGFLLGGEWKQRGERMVVRSPYDGEPVGETYRASADDMQQAIQAAVRAFGQTRKMATFERAAILETTAASICRERETLARCIALEAGKPLKTARVEVDRAVLTFTDAAEEIKRLEGEWLPLDRIEAARGCWGLVRRFPLGPIAAISPFNFPLNLVAHKLAPALGAGNSVVLKPASQTPLTALRLARLLDEAGAPPGALNVLPCAPAVAEPLITDDRFKLLTFTGSPAVGWELKSRARKKRVVLELGGNAGVIVHRDADIKHAVERCVLGGFSYAGQSCISVQRILVQKDVHDQFLDLFLPRVESLKVGDPLDESTDIGPMIHEKEAERVEEWVAEALEGGARLLLGGERQGALYPATVLADVKRDMKVNCQEVFAPLVTIGAYEEFDEALEQVNDSVYGLQAGVFTRDAGLIFRAYEALEVGGVVAGDAPSFRADPMPYGGVKDSGLGREGARYALEEMTERKILVVAPM